MKMIKSDRISCGIRVIDVEPFRTATKYGEPVEVWSFEQDVEGNSSVAASGFRIRKNGERYSRSQYLFGVEIPAEIASVLR